MYRGFLSCSVTLTPCSTPSTVIASIISQEASALDEKSQDFVSVLLDCLLGLRGTLSRTVQDVINKLAKLESASAMMQLIREQMRQRSEFEKVAKLVPQMQFSVFEAMTQCLELGIFHVTDKIALQVVLEAAKSILHTNNYEVLIRNCSSYDCKHFAEFLGIVDDSIGTPSFGSSQQLNIVRIILHLVITYVVLRCKLNQVLPLDSLH